MQPKICLKHPKLEGKKGANGCCLACNREYASERRKMFPKHISEVRAKSTSKLKNQPLVLLCKKHPHLNGVRNDQRRCPSCEENRHEAYALKNRDKEKVRKREYYLKNKETVILRSRDRAARVPVRVKQYKRKWVLSNKDLVAAKDARRRAAGLNATPGWSNEFFIAEAYHLSKIRQKLLGGKWHVDHIVPLLSKLVCGLHVEHNLQVIPAILNQTKSNVSWPNMPR